MVAECTTQDFDFHPLGRREVIGRLRLWFSSLAYVLLQTLGDVGLKGTELEKAQCGTIRLKVLKIGAQVRVTFRKVWVALAECDPWRSLFANVWTTLRRLPPRPVPD